MSSGKLSEFVYPWTLNDKINEFTCWEFNNNWKFWNTFNAYNPTILNPNTNKIRAGYVVYWDDSKTDGSLIGIVVGVTGVGVGVGIGAKVQLFAQASSSFKLESSHC